MILTVIASKCAFLTQLLAIWSGKFDGMRNENIMETYRGEI